MDIPHQNNGENEQSLTRGCQLQRLRSLCPRMRMYKWLQNLRRNDSASASQVPAIDHLSTWHKHTQHKTHRIVTLEENMFFATSIATHSKK